MDKIINWLDEHGLWEYIFEAAGKVAIALGVILFIVWALALAIAAVVLVGLIFTSSGWWLLAVIPWLLLVIITVAVGSFAWDKL